MKLLFLLLTIMFCFSVVGSKNHVSFKQLKDTTGQYWDIERSETENKEKYQQLLIPIVHDFIAVPEATYSFVYPTHEFSCSFHPSITSEICSQGPPLV